MFDINKIEFSDIPDQIVWIGNKVAEYTAQYEFLDDLSKVILATIGNKKNASSESERNRLALSDDEYKKHLEAKKIARNEMLRNKAYMQSLEAKFDYLRTLAANNRNQRY